MNCFSQNSSRKCRFRTEVVQLSAVFLRRPLQDGNIGCKANITQIPKGTWNGRLWPIRGRTSQRSNPILRHNRRAIQDHSKFKPLATNGLRLLATSIQDCHPTKLLTRSEMSVVILRTESRIREFMCSRCIFPMWEWVWPGQERLFSCIICRTDSRSSCSPSDRIFIAGRVTEWL